MTTRPVAQQLHKIQSQLKQIQASWPLDPLRLNQPDLQISNAIKKAIHRVTSNHYQSANSAPHDVDQRTLEGASRMLTSLENLSNGSISKKYPLPQSLLNPASFPRHYEELNEGVERATRGESLSWYRRWIRFT